ncbi:helix-turn-helix transcriptional regulator [Streptomyces sp. NPDC005438]|uniref:helix-turn-helix transcriptional regulator n=1 Tax=Streptomyces sp. NPDC005438 TaxID=3156880 RepID=UPI0033A22FC7
MYQERPSTVPGAVLWRIDPEPGEGTGRVLPDGCMDLLWWGDRLVVAGPDTVAQLTGRRAGPVVGLRFAPGTAPGVLGVPAHELRNRRVPLEDLWGAARVRRWGATAPPSGPGRWLEAIASNHWAAPDPALTHAVRLLGEGVGVAESADRLGLSARQLRRRSEVAFGYGPKTLARVLRMRRALQLGEATGESGGLAGVATAAGYADQAHMTRELRQLTGLTPGDLFSR